MWKHFFNVQLAFFGTYDLFMYYRNFDTRWLCVPYALSDDAHSARKKFWQDFLNNYAEFCIIMQNQGHNLFHPAIFDS